METPTNELILAEIIKITSKLESIDHKLDNVEHDIKDLKQGQIEILQTVNFIGNKVFDNHEKRIKALETSSQLS